MSRRSSRWVVWALGLVFIGLAILFTVLVTPMGIFVVFFVMMAVFQAARVSKGPRRNFPDIPL